MNTANGVLASNGHATGHLEIKMEPKPGENRKWARKGVLYQICMSICANVSVVGPAMSFGYSAVALGPLMSPDSDVQVDAVQANWIATASALGTPIGCVISSYVMNRGRRLSLLVTSVISMIGWLIIYISGSYEQILAGRAISGIATGLASVPATVYTAEIAGTPKLRSTMVTWTSISIAVGVLVVYIYGYMFQDNWRLVALMCALWPLLACILALTVIPESPLWLRDHGRMDEAVEVLKTFRGIPKDRAATPELLAEIQPRAQAKKQNLMKHLLKRNAQIPLAIMLCYFFFQQFSGIFVVVYYAVDIIESAGITLDPYLGAVLIGLTRLIGSLLVAGMSKRYGRRVPSVLSGGGMTLSVGALAVYLLMEDQGIELGDNGVIPVICVLMFIFMSSFGYLVIPFAMVGEIYPTKVKDILSGVTTCVAYIFSSVTVKTYPDMLRLMGKHGVFFFYAFMSLAGTVFLLLFLPETKGKSLHEIEDMFRRKKPSEDPAEKEKMVGMADLSAGA